MCVSDQGWRSKLTDCHMVSSIPCKYSPVSLASPSYVFVPQLLPTPPKQNLAVVVVPAALKAGASTVVFGGTP